MKNRDTRKSKAFRKGAKKGQWRTFLVRALSALSHTYLARYPSYGTVMQARNGWGGGNTFLLILSLLSVCSIRGSRFWAYVVLGCSFDLLIVFWSRLLNGLVWSWVVILEDAPFTFLFIFSWEIRIIEAIVRVMLMQTHSCFWKLGECIRMPTVVWTEIDRVSKIGSEQK